MKFLERKLGPIKLWWLIAFWCVLAIGIIVGSFADLEISKAIAGDSFISKVGESFGELFGYAVGPAAGAMILYGLSRKEKALWLKIAGVVIALISIGATTYFAKDNCAGTAGYSWLLPDYAGYIIAGGWSLLVFGITYFVIDRTVDANEVALKGFIIAFAFAFTMALVNFILKKMGYRPRYRAMAWGNDTYGATAMSLNRYQNWWDFNWFHKPEWFKSYTDLNSTIDEHVLSDSIKSWPSGHSTCAAQTLMYPIILSVTGARKDKKYGWITFAVACVYTLFVMLLRILRGAHFLSDVCWGALVASLTIGATLGIAKLYLNKSKKFSIELLEKE